MITAKYRVLYCIFLFLASFFLFSEEKEKILKVLVEGAIPKQGQVILSIFSSKDDYLKKPVRDIVQKIDADGKSVFDIYGLPAGSYSVSAVYDEDGNGKLNTGFMGIPSELVGFSNNAKGIFGPPSYEKTVFEFHSAMEILIHLGKAEK